MLCLLLAAFLQAVPMIDSVAQGRTSGIGEPRQVVVRSAGEWQALWKEHGGAERPETIDFAKFTVVGVFLGTRPTGGYSVEIAGTRREGETLVIEYLERRPAPDALVSQALTAPFHVIRVPRHDGPVTFRSAAAPPPRPII